MSKAGVTVSLMSSDRELRKLLRVFTASLGSETNTFSPLPTDIDAFYDTFYAPPGTHPPTPTLCSAPILVLRKLALASPTEVVVVEGTAAWAEPAGMISRSAFETLRDEILDQLRAAMPVDAVVLGLHGAMIAQGYDDPEGDLLSRIRGIVGPRCIIAAELDPHSHLTDLRFDSADILVAFKEFAHVDFVERAEEVVDLALRAARNEISITMEKFDCKMVEVLPTSTEPMRSFVDKMMRLEANSRLSTMSLIDPETYTGGDDPGLLSISCIHGFMPADVPDMGSQIIVITNNDAKKAARIAKELGLELFSFRGTTRPAYLSIGDAFAVAATALMPGSVVDDAIRGKDASGPVVIADVWDNPGGGTAGDATWIVQRCLSEGIDGVAFATIWDPQAARLCHAAGEGATLQLRFGGKTAPEAHSGAPIDALVTVRRVVKNATHSFGASVVPLGDSAQIEIPLPGGGGGEIRVILNTNRTQTFDPDAFANMGVDISSQRVLVVKSTNHFFPAFTKVARAVLYVDTALDAGSPYPSNPSKTPYLKLVREIWPIVDDPHGIGSEHVPWDRTSPAAAL